MSVRLICLQHVRHNAARAAALSAIADPCIKVNYRLYKVYNG